MVMTNGRQTSGDYGYDLAHEDRPDALAPDVRPGHEAGSTTPAGRQDEQDEQDQDLSYDEAHDF
jgi:hypothetical protein